MTPRGRDLERREIDLAFKLQLPRTVRVCTVSLDPSVHVRAGVDDSGYEPRFPACNRRIDRAILRVAIPTPLPAFASRPRSIIRAASANPCTLPRSVSLSWHAEANGRNAMPSPDGSNVNRGIALKFAPASIRIVATS
jgi:hypothetical protein